MDEVLPRVLNSLIRIFAQADQGLIALLEEDGTLIPCLTHSSRQHTSETIRIHDALAQKAMENQRAYLSTDRVTDRESQDPRSRSFMCATLIDTQGESIGLLQLASISPSESFHQEDLRIFATMSDHVGIAIDRAQRYEQSLQQSDLIRDLEMASQLQRRLLPQQAPDVKDYEFFDFHRPKQQVSGDYFDYLQLPDGRIAVIVAEVAGSGTIAAMLTARLSVELDYCVALAPAPGKTLSLLNDRLCTRKLNHLVTMALVFLDPLRHEISVANAGHLPPLFHRQDGTLTELGAGQSGWPMGLLPNVEYATTTQEIGCGDAIFMYTDGLTEAVNDTDDCYDGDRLRASINSSVGNPGELGTAIVSEVLHFMDKTPQDDDMCLLVFGRGPAPKNPTSNEP